MFVCEKVDSESLSDVAETTQLGNRSEYVQSRELMRTAAFLTACVVCLFSAMALD